MESAVGLNFTAGRWKACFALWSTNEIEDFLLACSELGHRCSTEHYTSSARGANIISDPLFEQPDRSVRTRSWAIRHCTSRRHFRFCPGNPRTVQREVLLFLYSLDERARIAQERVPTKCNRRSRPLFACDAIEKRNASDHCCQQRFLIQHSKSMPLFL
jgi:hypothetical protein